MATGLIPAATETPRPPTEMTSAPRIVPDRYIDSGALVCGSSAWLISRILRSPNVATVVNNPPVWLDRADVAATVEAIHKAGRAFELAAVALEREDATVLGAVSAQSSPKEWTTRRAADYLGISVRRAQELAPELGGRRVGRQWILNELAVREYRRWREHAA